MPVDGQVNHLKHLSVFFYFLKNLSDRVIGVIQWAYWMITMAIVAELNHIKYDFNLAKHLQRWANSLTAKYRAHEN